MRIVYMGTPDIAVPTLRYLAESKHQVVGVLTQPDRPKGRGHHTIPTAVKAAALEYDIPVYQPLSLRKGEDAAAALETLRQPLEDGVVTITRASGTVSYPCSFMLVGAMNPCPCGYYGHPKRQCTCTDRQVRQYLNRISGPLLDRFDLHIEVEPVSFDSLSARAKAESSAAIRERVQAAREWQNQRFSGTGIFCNAAIPAGMLQDFCPMDDGAVTLLRAVFDKLGLSARAYDRILKVARTIADLDGSDIIRKQHIASAAQFRSLDRKYWGTGG